MIEINTNWIESFTTTAQFAEFVADIRSALVAQLGVDPNDPANDPIQALVLCYGVPFWVNMPPGVEPESVDSWLTLLFNRDPDLYPGCGTGSLQNPYFDKDIDFETFRASTDNNTGSFGQSFKMRYLVCRLDGYTDPLVDVPGYGTMPKDVKDMIDRASDAGSQRGRFVLDNAWNGDYTYLTYDTSDLQPAIGPDLIINDPDQGDSQCYVNTFQDSLGVMAYASYGMHDLDIVRNTEWGRPYFNWKPGAICIPNESYSGSALRYGLFAGWPKVDPDEPDLVPPTLLEDTPVLRLGKARCATEMKALAGCRMALLNSAYPYPPVKWIRNGVEADVEAYVDTEGIAEIDLSDPTIQWQPDQNGYMSTRVQLYFPDDDRSYHDREPLCASYPLSGEYDVYRAVLAGDGFQMPTLGLGRQKTSEYIRGGCTGATAAVSEPGINYVDASVTFARYAKGYSWSEAAYMGMKWIDKKTVILGDPLMAPFADYLSLSFLPPTPDDGRTIKGTVPLEVSAIPDLGSITRVEFYVTDSATSTRRLVGTDTSTPYEVQWDSAEMLNGDPVYPDGGYTVEAVAYQDERTGGSATTTRTITLDNTNQPTVTVTEPTADYMAVTVAVPVAAQAEGVPSEVEFWLFDGGNPILAGTATAAPYECSISSAVAGNGVYALQAIAYYDSSQALSYSTRRMIVLANDVLALTSIAALDGAADDAEVYVVGVPVTSGTCQANDGTFYVEDTDRVSGIQVHSSTSVTTGKLVTIGGLLHITDGERYIDAGDWVWDMGSADVPRALTMTSGSIGGIPPSGMVGVSDGSGVYNTGLLVRLWGAVTYVGADYVYVTDDGRLVDGSGLYEYAPVPLNGDDISVPGPAVRGTRVYMPDIAEKPRIGDMVLVTGISSLRQEGQGYVRMLRPRGANDIVYGKQYPRAFGAPARLVWPDSTDVPVGSRVHLADQYVEYNSGSELWVIETDPAHTNACTSLSVTTGLQVGDYITILGEYAGQNQYGWAQVTPHSIYLVSGSQALGQSQSLSLLALEDLYAPPDDPLQNLWSEIGSALSQPSGSTVDLTGVMVISQSEDGMTWGLKDLDEPLPAQPRLVFRLEQPVLGIASSFQIDVHGGTRTTLSDGRPAIANPAEVLVYTDTIGRLCPPVPMRPAVSGMLSDRPWKRRIFP